MTIMSLIKQCIEDSYMSIEERNKFKGDLKNPIQPLFEDENGTLRFKSNSIVEYLVREGKADLNQIAMMDFSQDDREQFSQLHGYSLSGFGGLGSTTNETYYAAVKMHENPELNELQARYDALLEQFEGLKEAIQAPMKLLAEVAHDYELDIDE